MLSHRPPSRMDFMNTRRVALFSFGHLVTDLVSGCIPALLPFFAAAHHWSYGSLGAIWLVASVSNALFQPLWGILADRVGGHFLMPIGLVTNAFGIVLVGMAPGYAVVLAGAAICGLGSSAFHPDAQHAVHQNSSERPAMALSWFQVAGNFGMAVGPLMVALLASPGGTGAIGLIGLPAVVGAGLLFYDAAKVRRARLAIPTAPGDAHSPAVSPRPRGHALRPAAVGGVPAAPSGLARIMASLGGIIVLRAFAQAALGTYTALYYQDAYGWTATEVQYLLFGFLAAGALGTLVGGYWADAVGERRVILTSLSALVVPALAVRLLSPVPGAMFTIVSGFVVMSTWSTTTSYAQRLYPERVGMMSGLMTGLTIGMAGIAAQILGLIADAAGLAWTLNIAVAVALPAAFVSSRLPAAIVRPATERTVQSAAL